MLGLERGGGSALNLGKGGRARVEGCGGGGGKGPLKYTCCVISFINLLNHSIRL